MRRAGSIERAVAAALAALAGAGGFAHAAGPLSLRAEASYTSDDNVTRAKPEDALKDVVLGAGVKAIYPVPVSQRTRAVLQGFAGTERFRTHTGLSRNFIGAQGEFQFRSSGEFGAATYTAFARAAKDQYESNLRDGYRSAYGLTVLKPATDRLQLFGALAWNISDGKSAVFDTKTVSLRGNVDWSIGRWDTVYLGAEYRRGDTVGTTGPTLNLVPSPNVADDAFTDAARTAYRFKSAIRVATLGYNHAFGERHSVDVSWRRAQSRAMNLDPGLLASDFDYTLTQFSVAYLARF